MLQYWCMVEIGKWTLAGFEAATLALAANALLTEPKSQIAKLTGRPPVIPMNPFLFREGGGGGRSEKPCPYSQTILPRDEPHDLEQAQPRIHIEMQAF